MDANGNERDIPGGQNHILPKPKLTVKNVHQYTDGNRESGEP
jgi:hypothetical protein